MKFGLDSVVCGAAILALVSCAGGPRPVPTSATASERLEFSEQATLAAHASASFEIESKGAHDTHFTGTLTLTGSNALSLVAEGVFDKEPVHLDFSSMSGDIHRTVTKGPSASAQKNALPPALNEAVAVALVRQGLLHNLAMLAADQMVSKAEGGIREEIQVSDAKDGGPDAVGAVTCHRVDSTLLVGGKPTGEGSVCIADANGLPVQRRLTVHFPEGDMSVSERFTWTQK